jgi:flagellar biosynthetic protein FliQ
MNEDFILGIGQEAIKVTMMIAAPMLFVAMIIGIIVSLIQAVTQINEATLTFIPKIIAIGIVLVVGGPWMLETLTQYTTEIFTRLPDFIR